MAVTEHQIVSLLLRERMMILARIDAVVRDAHRAEDVLQEVSMAALNKRDTIADVDHLRAWLRKVARDKAIDAVRRESRRPLVFSDRMLDLIESEWESFDRTDSVGLQEMLLACIGELSPYTQELVKRRYGENLTGNQLAVAMGRTANTVKVALTRTHRALLECLRRRTSMEGND